MSFSATFGAVFKIAILCMVCNKLFCSVHYSGRCFKREGVWPLFKCATMFEKDILLTSEVPGLQPQCHSRNRSLMPARQQ